MKKMLLSLMLATVGISGYAQSSIANGATCPNITIKDTKGVEHKLYDYCNAGKYVLIDFFAYWCGPCKATAPTIEQFYKKYGCNSGNVIVLGNESDPAGTLATLKGFDTDAGLDPDNSYPSTYGSIGGATNSSTYGVSAFPTIILVGPDKKMINNDIWPVNNITSLESVFPAGVLTPKACAAPASVNDISTRVQIHLSPNPAVDQLLVDATQMKRLRVMNQLGGTVLSMNQLNDSNSMTIDISKLATGLYLLEVETADGTAVRKFTKQ